MARNAKKKKRSSVSPQGVKAAPWSVPWRTIIGGALILLAAFVVLWPVTHADFIADDAFYIQNNKMLDRPDRLWKAWFEPGSFIEYYPIEESLQWVQYLFFHKDPTGYHVVNLVLHAINSLAVWYFLAKLRLRFAWLGGLIYAVHPLAVESVGYAAEFKNTLSLTPFVLSMCFCVDFMRDGKMRAYLPALGLFTVAMLCKISMLCFPLVLLLYAWYLHGRISRRDLELFAPFAAIAAGLSALSIWSGEVYNAYIHDVVPGPIPIGGLLSRTALVGLISIFNLAHALVPFRPMMLYPLWQIDPPSLLDFLPWVFFAVVVGVLWVKRNSWGRHVILALGAFYIILLPTLGFHNVSYMCLTFVSDHFLYIPVIFVIALAVAALDDIEQKLPAVSRRWIFAVPTLAVAAMAIEAYNYANIFSDQLQLFTYEEEYNPNSWAVDNLLGVALLKNGKNDEGIQVLERSIALNPNYSVPHVALAGTYFKLENYPEAEHHFREILRINPYTQMAYMGLGATLEREERLQEADDIFAQDIQRYPNDVDAYDYLGVIEAKLGHNDNAIKYFRQALQLRSNDPSARQNLMLLSQP